MRAPIAWKDLQKVYLGFLSARSSSDNDLWLAIWQRFLEHSYFRRRARQIARTRLRALNRTADSEFDLLAVALTMFAKRIQAPCDTETVQRIRHDFRGWLTSVLVEDCQSALLSMPRYARQRRRHLATDSSMPDSIHIRAHELVARLADPQRSVLLLHLSGLSLSKIAEALDLSSSRVDCLIRIGVEMLRWQLLRHR